MTSHFRVVRYVPDPVADERINVGVIVVGTGLVRTKFLSEWGRVARFGGEDVAFLRDFAKRASDATRPQAGLQDDNTRWNEAFIERELSRWHNSIQISEPRASLKDPDALVGDAFRRYVHARAPRRHGFRDKRRAVKLAVESLRSALANRFGDRGEELVQRNTVISGSLDQHKFDFALRNGRTVLASQALSFEVPDAKSLGRDIDAAAWAIDDVRSHDNSIDLCVAVLPPSKRTKDYERAERIFGGLGATVITDLELDTWAAKVVEGMKL